MSGCNRRKRAAEGAPSSDQPSRKVQRMTAPPLGFRQTAAIEDDTSERQSATNQQVSSNKPFRFLDLPAELRNHVYEATLEDHPTARLSHKTNKREIQTTNPFVLVSKQVHGEFRAILMTKSPQIHTTIWNFNFGHIITFFNRLSEIDLHSIKTGSVSGDRVMQVELRFDDPIRLGFTRKEQAALDRWFKRSRTTKKGVEIEMQYVWNSTDFRVQDRWKQIDKLMEVERRRWIVVAKLQPRRSELYMSS